MPAILGSRQAPSPRIKKSRYGAGQFVGYRVDTTMKTVFRPPWLFPPQRFCRLAGQWLGGAVLWALLVAGAAMAASTPMQGQVQVDGTSTTMDLWPAVQVLADPGKTMTLDAVLKSADRFARPTTAPSTLGMRTEAVWLRVPLQVTPSGADDWVLEINYAVLNRIEVYLVVDQQVQHRALLGNLQPPINGARNARAGHDVAAQARHRL